MKEVLNIFIIIILFLIICTLCGFSLCTWRKLYVAHIAPAKPLNKSLRLHVFSKKKQNDLQTIVKRVSSTLKSSGILHWPIGGTLIGCLRHQGPIPWDDDADFGVLSKDWPQVKKSLEEAWPKKIKIKKAFFYKLNLFYKISFKDLHGDLDIFLYKKNDCGLIKLEGVLSNFLYKSQEIKDQPVIKDVLQYGDITLDFIGDPIDTCNTQFPGWDKTYVIHPAHSNYDRVFGVFRHRRYCPANTPY